MSEGDIRTRILDAATTVLGELRRPTSQVLSMVAARAGVSRPTVYRYIGRQPDLFAALLQRELERLLDDVILPQLGDLDSPREDLLRAGATLVVEARTHPVVTFLHEEYPDVLLRQLANFVPAMVRVSLDRIEPLIRRAVAEGRMSPIDAEVLLTWTGRIVVAYLVGPEDGCTLDEVERAMAGLVDTARALGPPSRVRDQPVLRTPTARDVGPHRRAAGEDEAGADGEPRPR